MKYINYFKKRKYILLSSLLQRVSSSEKINLKLLTYNVIAMMANGNNILLITSLNIKKKWKSKRFWILAILYDENFQKDFFYTADDFTAPSGRRIYHHSFLWRRGEEFHYRTAEQKAEYTGDYWSQRYWFHRSAKFPQRFRWI